MESEKQRNKVTEFFEFSKLLILNMADLTTFIACNTPTASVFEGEHESIQSALKIRVKTLSHRTEAITLPADPQEATAQALAFIRGDDIYVRSQALEALNQRVSVLLEADSEKALTALAHQLPVMETLWLTFAAQASAATKVEHRAIYLRMALSAQASFSRTLTLIAGLRQQRGGRSTVSVNDVDEGQF